MVKKRVVDGPSVSPRDDDKDWAHVPFLRDFFFAAKYDDGSPRESGTMTVFTECGRLKCVLTETTAWLSGFVTLDGPELFCEQLEAFLRDDKVDWRKKRKK